MTEICDLMIQAIDLTLENRFEEADKTWEQVDKLIEALR